MIKISEYIQARKSQLYFYVDVPLYNQVDNKNFLLYKPQGLSLGEMRLNEDRHPEKLYIKQSDKIQGIQEAQKAFNTQLEDNIKTSPEKVKETLVLVVEETLTEPRSGSLEGISDTIDILVSDYAKESGVISNLISMSSKDYSTVLHSINVMAFTLAFAFYNDYSHSETQILGLASLLHDVGKTKLPREILEAPRKLTDEEFEIIKTHTTIGYDILKECNFKNEEISLCALEHHEKLDGSGYPDNKTDISPMSQIIGIVDCYEAITNDDRPYRSAMQTFDALGQVVGKDVNSGKFSKEIYIQFVQSLTGKNKT